MVWSSEERSRFIKDLTAVAEMYARELSETTLAMYMEILQKYPYWMVKRAILAYVQNFSGRASFFPKPGDLIALIEGNPDDRAVSMWMEVLEALEKIGTYHSVKFRDPLVNVCIAKLGGWMKLGELSQSELDKLYYQFCKLYRYFYQNGRIPLIDHLPGKIETINNARGMREYIPQPITVGSELPPSVRNRIVFSNREKETKRLKDDQENNHFSLTEKERQKEVKLEKASC